MPAALRLSAMAALLWAGIGVAAPPSAPAARPRPAWVKQGIVMVGNWEPLTFIRRRGGQTMEDVENWKLERTEEVARKLKEAGVNLVVTNLHKGFGLKTEAEDMEATRRFVEYAHRHGIRVGGYIGATMMFETFFAEEPAARDWRAIDERGEPVIYNAAQPFRYVACRNNPGYDAFIRKLLDVGIRDMKLDLIHFDQMEFWPEPHGCRCRFCQAQFRDFLKRKYAAKDALARFGFTRLDDIVPPLFGPFMAERLPVLVNPAMQDWVEFRAWSCAERFREYDAYIHKLNPEVALEGNPNVDLGLNKGALQATDYGSLLEHGDIVWSEEPQQASWTGDGRLVSKIRSFKVVRRMGKSLFMYTGGRYGAQQPDSPPQLRLAEAMAYNDNSLGMVGDVSPAGITLTPEARRYIDFFHAHRAAFTGAAPIADAAVLRSFASIEYNPSRSNVATVLFEQSLIQGKVPFDIILDRHLADLSGYKVLVLAEQDALSDEQCEAIRRYVAAGGGLVATGDSSLWTEWRIKRRKFGLADLFGRDVPNLGPRAQPLRREFGRGRVVYIPAVRPAVEPPPAQFAYRFDNRAWVLPLNHDELLASVEWAARGRLSARVAAPLSVTAEPATRKDGGAMLLHLVNFDFRNPVENLAVTLRLPVGATPGEIVLETPDTGRREVVSGTASDGAVSFRVPRLEVYGLATVELRKAAP